MKFIGLLLLFVALSSGTLTPLQSQVGTGIIGGRDARPNEFPYLVALRSDNDNQDFICGGSLIKKGQVLTAAHCFERYNISDIRVVAGEDSLSINDGTEQYSRISSLIIHKYYRHSLLYDIALVKLSVDFILNNWVQIISLPPKYQQYFGTAIISGWGNTDGQNDQLEYPDILQTAEISLLSNNECGYVYYNPMICAGDSNPNKGVSFGDSGGPLVQNNILIGVASRIKNETRLSVFVEVSSFLTWINKNT